MPYHCDRSPAFYLVFVAMEPPSYGRSYSENLEIVCTYNFTVDSGGMIAAAKIDPDLRVSRQSGECIIVIAVV